MKCQINTSLLPLCLKACSAHYPSLPEDVPKRPTAFPFFSTTKKPQASCQSTELSTELEEHFKLEVHPSPALEHPQKLTAWGMMLHSSAAGKPQLWRNRVRIPGLSNQSHFDAHSYIKGSPTSNFPWHTGIQHKYLLITELMGHVFSWQCCQHTSRQSFDLWRLRTLV